LKEWRQCSRPSPSYLSQLERIAANYLPNLDKCHGGV
jgi:hypothetical protein